MLIKKQTEDRWLCGFAYTQGAIDIKIHEFDVARISGGSNAASGNKGAAYSEKVNISVFGGVSLAPVNSNGWTSLMVAGSWHWNWLDEILNPTTDQPQGHPLEVPYLFICLPVMSIIEIALVCGRRGNDCLTPCRDPFPVCMERKCIVASGCGHEF
ncbi:hypothetical protein Bca52824_018690 [Brassica carinata]|uniref:Uncharacterized protein n=1 Tax=Brassica carinata TaxID=52824 RepID=A0A8X7VR17_BRACI|nr:hypothetical protein Bca52824_018690 [Brassica carinata]